METGTTGETTEEPRSPHARLLALLDQAEADHAAFLESTSEAERMATGTPEHWCIKDHLAHLNFWREVSLERLEAAATGATPPDTSEFQPLNEQTFERERETPWERLTVRADDLFAAVRAQIERLNDEELSDPERYPWRQGQPLSTVISGNFYEHPIEHYVQIALERGETAEAFALQQAMIRTIRELLGVGESYANALYNLACFYARQGEGERAIDPLSEALTLRPALVEWSQRDADLDPLRELPAFQELFVDHPVQG